MVPIGWKNIVIQRQYDIQKILILNWPWVTLSIPKKYYIKIFGYTMVSPLSPKITDLALTQLENDLIPSLDYVILIYCRYVDGILLGISTYKVEYTLDDEKIDLTLKLPSTNSINFLDDTLS